jgi:hypothetical protein
LLGQLTALHRFLEREYGTAERCPPLLGWVRVRCGVAECPLNNKFSGAGREDNTPTSILARWVAQR